MNLDEMRRDETRRDETRRDETRVDETRVDETRGDETRREETRREETRGDETRVIRRLFFIALMADMTCSIGGRSEVDWCKHCCSSSAYAFRQLERN